MRLEGGGNPKVFLQKKSQKIGTDKGIPGQSLCSSYTKGAWKSEFSLSVSEYVLLNVFKGLDPFLGKIS